MVQETRYTLRHQSADWIQRATAQTIQAPVYHNGELVAPTSGAVSVIDPNGTAHVDAQAVTVTDDIATYRILAATVPATLDLSARWIIRWVLIIGGTTYTFHRDAALVRSRVYPVITDLDLERRHTELREWKPRDRSSFQPQIDEAWDMIMARLMEDGKYPYLILSPHSLRTVHTYGTNEILFTDMASALNNNGKYAAMAAMYGKKYEAAWDRLVFNYDTDQDGRIDDEEEGLAGVPVLMTNRPGNWGWIR